MKTNKVDKEELLAKLRENREKHKETFKKADKEWRKKATKALRKAAEAAPDKIDAYPLNKLPAPESYLGSYDQVIARLEMEVEDTVELDENEFAYFVLDNWHWRGQFAANTRQYVG